MTTRAGVLARGLDKDHFVAFVVDVDNSKLALYNVKNGSWTLIQNTDVPVWWSAGTDIWLMLRVHYNQISTRYSQDGLTWKTAMATQELDGVQSGTAWTWANFSENDLIPNCTGRVGYVGQGYSDETDEFA